jgi:hypothetical protein
VKGSGIGRETHAMMLAHYQQTKNLLVSYSPTKLGFLIGRAARSAEGADGPTRRPRR